MPDISEKNFETIIETLLLAGGLDDPEHNRTLREYRAALISSVVTGKVDVSDGKN